MTHETLTVGDIKQMLEDVDDDTLVYLAHQPSWPFKYSIADIHIMYDDEMVVECPTCGTGVEATATQCAAFGAFAPGHGNVDVVYITEGKQLEYLPKFVVEAIGW